MTLFGKPLAGGNTVFFLPTQFKAFLPADETATSTRVLQVDDTTNFAIFPHGNQIITDLKLVEQGDYTHIGGGLFDGYIVHGRVFVRHADSPAQFASTPFEHTFTDGSDATILDVWEFEQEIATPGLPSDVWITIENFLVIIDQGQSVGLPGQQPQGGFGSEVFIQKKFIGFEVGIAPVPIALTAMPIPAAFWFMSSALAALGVVKRRAR